MTFGLVAGDVHREEVVTRALDRAALGAAVRADHVDAVADAGRVLEVRLVAGGQANPGADVDRLERIAGRAARVETHPLLLVVAVEEVGRVDHHAHRAVADLPVAAGGRIECRFAGAGAAGETARSPAAAACSNPRRRRHPSPPRYRRATPRRRQRRSCPRWRQRRSCPPRRPRRSCPPRRPRRPCPPRRPSPPRRPCPPRRSCPPRHPRRSCPPRRSYLPRRSNPPRRRRRSSPRHRPLPYRRTNRRSSLRHRPCAATPAVRRHEGAGCPATATRRRNDEREIDPRAGAPLADQRLVSLSYMWERETGETERGQVSCPVPTARLTEPKRRRPIVIGSRAFP